MCTLGPNANEEMCHKDCAVYDAIISALRYPGDLFVLFRTAVVKEYDLQYVQYCRYLVHLKPCYCRCYGILVYGLMEAGYVCLCNFVLGCLTGRPPIKMYGRPIPTHASVFMSKPSRVRRRLIDVHFILDRLEHTKVQGSSLGSAVQRSQHDD